MQHYVFVHSTVLGPIENFLDDLHSRGYTFMQMWEPTNPGKFKGVFDDTTYMVLVSLSGNVAEPETVTDAPSVPSETVTEKLAGINRDLNSRLDTILRDAFKQEAHSMLDATAKSRTQLIIETRNKLLELFGQGSS